MNILVLKNLVCSVLGVKSQQIELKGVLPSDFYMEEKNCGGNMFDVNSDLKVYGYSERKGLVEVKGENTGYSQNANGTQNKEYAVSYGNCYNNFPDADFFITSLREWGWQEGKNSWDRKKVQIFVSPNFEKIEQEKEENEDKKFHQWYNTFAK